MEGLPGMLYALPLNLLTWFLQLTSSFLLPKFACLESATACEQTGARSFWHGQRLFPLPHLRAFDCAE